MRPEALTNRAYWQQQTAAFVPYQVRDNPFAKLFERYLPHDPSLQCVEIGAYPGGFLCYLAKRFGYQAAAIEYRPDADDIARFFTFNGLPPPHIINADFFDYVGPQFDIVCSFGFAEHFSNFPAVLAHHVRLVRPGGLLVLSMPHVRGYQGLIRRLVYTREAYEEMLETHNLEVMNLDVVKRNLSLAGLQILHASYAMGGHQWVRSTSPRVRPSARLLVDSLAWVDRHIGVHLPSSRWFSPMIFTVSRKILQKDD